VFVSGFGHLGLDIVLLVTVTLFCSNIHTNRWHPLLSYTRGLAGCDHAGHR